MHLTWKSRQELHHHLSLSYSLSHLPQWALAQGLCQKCLRIWGGAAGRKHSYQGLSFLPHRDWKKICKNMLETTDTPVHILMASASCYYHCHSVKTRNCHLLPQKRAWLSVPLLPHFFWPQTHTALRNSCIHSSAWSTRVSRELVLDRCSPTVRGWWGGAGNCAQPGWEKSVPGQSPLLLL